MVGRLLSTVFGSKPDMIQCGSVLIRYGHTGSAMPDLPRYAAKGDFIDKNWKKKLSKRTENYASSAIRRIIGAGLPEARELNGILMRTLPNLGES